MSKKRAIRFAVVHPDTGGHSGVWRVWAHGDDVYLAPSEHAGTYKVSLHPNVYRVAFTREHWATGEVPNNAPGPGRAMVEYLPTERDEGVEYAWMVGFQPDALLDTRELESNVVRIVAPDVHHIVQVDLWICEPSVTRRPEFAVDPVPLQLDDGRILWVGYHAYVPANESDYMPGRTDYVGSMAEFSDRVAPTSAPGFVIRPVDVA